MTYTLLNFTKKGGSKLSHFSSNNYFDIAKKVEGTYSVLQKMDDNKLVYIKHLEKVR